VVLDGDWLLLDGDWLELEDDGIELDWLLEDDGELLDDVSLEVELDVLDEGDALEALEPDWPHLSIAAWVFGPRMPSIGPGLQPCAFSCCCCWRTDSSPLELAPELEPEVLVEAFASVELDGMALALEELEGDCEADGDCELVADCELFEALEEGGLVLNDCDCAYAEPAARMAATAMASFLEVIGCSFPVGWGGGRNAGNAAPGPCAARWNLHASDVPASAASYGGSAPRGVSDRRHARNPCGKVLP